MEQLKAWAKIPQATEITEFSEELRECFLIHHKGHKEHKGWVRKGQNSCQSVKFVA
jgi:hypothetical protein